MAATDSADINHAEPPPAVGQPDFVGRARELRALLAALESADRGVGGVVLLVGEPGIGKTRTAEELSVHARVRGAWVLWGRCYEGDGAPAFWPWVQIIRSYMRARDLDALRAEMQAGAADIAGLVPELHDLLPDLPPVSPISSSPPTIATTTLRYRAWWMAPQALRRKPGRPCHTRKRSPTHTGRSRMYWPKAIR